MPRAATNEDVRRLTREQAAQLVEVLPQEDYDEEHIVGAINLPLKQFTPDNIARLDRSRPVIVYCHDYL